jgi:hypothetical protein
MLLVFESHGRGHFPDRSSHQQARALHNIEIGGRGGTVNSFCFFHFDTCLSFVSLSGVVRTFVCYLSGLKFVFRLLVPFHDVLPWTRFCSLGLLQRLYFTMSCVFAFKAVVHSVHFSFSCFIMLVNDHHQVFGKTTDLGL